MGVSTVSHNIGCSISTSSVGRIPYREPRNEPGDPPGEPGPPGGPDALEEPDRSGVPEIQPRDTSRDSPKVHTSSKPLTEVLSAVRDYYDVRYPCSSNCLCRSFLNQRVTLNRNVSELLISRVKSLEDSLKQPPEGEIEEMRRRELQRSFV